MASDLSLPHRQSVGRITDPRTAFLLGLAGLLGAFVAQLWLSRESFVLPLVLYALSAAAFLLSARRPKTEPGAPEATAPSAEPRRGQPTMAVALLTLSVVPLVMAVYVWQTSRFVSPGSYLGLVDFGVSLVLVVAGLLCLDGPRRLRLPRLLLRREVLLEILAVALICLIALYFRTDALASAPPAVWYDEADTGMEAYQTWEGAPYSPMSFGFRYNPSMYNYLVFLGYKLFGPGLLAVRLVTAILGTLGVLSLYPLGRLLLGRNAALVALLLLAVQRWHVDFSRFGMANIMVTIFAPLALYFLLKALRSGRWSDFGWAGLIFGLGVHTYNSYRVLLAAPVLVVLFYVVKNRGVTKRLCLQLAFSLALFVLAIAPLAQYSVLYPAEFWARTGQTSVLANKQNVGEVISAIGSNIKAHALMFNYQGDRNPRHNLPEAPMLDPLSGSLLVLGVLLALRRIRDPGIFTCLAWLGAGLLAGILTLEWEAPQGARTIVVTPVLALFGGIAVKHLLDLSRRTIWGALRIEFVVLAPLLMFAIWHNSHTYFDVHMKLPETYYEFSGRDTAVGEYLADNCTTTTPCYVHGPVTRVAQFLNYGRKNTRELDLMRDIPLKKSTESEFTIVFEPWRDPAPRYLLPHFYPNGKRDAVEGPDGQTVLMSYELTASDVEAISGLRRTIRDVGSGQLVSETVASSLEAPAVQQNNTVEWAGLLNVPASGHYVFTLPATGEGKVTIDGQAILGAPDQREAGIDLATGLHRFRLELRNSVPGQQSLLWSSPTQSTASPIERQYLVATDLPEHGLSARYYANPEWSGLPDLVTVDPIIDFRWQSLPFNSKKWSASWKGSLIVDKPGEYWLYIFTNDSGSLAIDGAEAVSTSKAGKYGAKISLEAGEHPVELKFRDTRGYAEFRWFWVPPGEAEGPVPYENMRPG